MATSSYHMPVPANDIFVAQSMPTSSLSPASSRYQPTHAINGAPAQEMTQSTMSMDQNLAELDSGTYDFDFMNANGAADADQMSLSAYADPFRASPPPAGYHCQPYVTAQNESDVQEQHREEAAALTVNAVFGMNSPIQSRSVRPLNHLQLIIWGDFTAGASMRHISDDRGIKPSTVLSYLIYILDSYSPSPLHPILLYWDRFDVPSEVKATTYAAFHQLGGAMFDRLDIIKDRLANSVLYDDIRLCLIRYKIERAVAHMFSSYTIKDNAKDETNKNNQDGPEQHQLVTDAASAKAVSDDTTSAAIIPAFSDNVMLGQISSLTTVTNLIGPTVKPPFPPRLHPSEVLYYLTNHGAAQRQCIEHHFQVDFTQIEPIIQQLIEDKLVWKRGPLYSLS